MLRNLALPPAIALVLAWSGSAMSAPAFGPFATKAAPVTVDAKDAVSKPERLPSGDFYGFAFQVYQRTLSAQDGPRCAHAPTCSLYGVQAVRRHRVIGFFLTVERLWRAGRSSELRPLPKVYGGETTRLYDPLDANDFWLRDIPDLEAPLLLPKRSVQ